ncbi:IS66 family insertion sequence element accessory protein TnpB [Sinorhizobium meliloti]|uniref:IS66 family insertion sequence element accessory protein TnpB n=1 Tax=Rhizobium meliloti TaxID=382 RepID=UPI000FDA6B99|nr:hypothetical protein CN137_33710 [Sinorhizobium meliloti]
MFKLGADLQVYLHREPIDFRAGINSLAVLVQETMALDPFAPAVFAFCNRRRQRPTFYIRFSFCDDSLSVASTIRLQGAGLALSSRQDADADPYGRASRSSLP